MPKALPVSLAIGGVSMALSLVIGIGMGILAALRQNSVVDFLVMFISNLGSVVPSFVIGPVLVLVFALWLRWLPAGGWDNFAWQFMLMPVAGFHWTKGEPKTFAHPDKENAVTRAFCATCGTHITTRRPGLDAVVLKIGTLDDPTLYGGPAIAIFTEDKQPFHVVPDGVHQFEKLPPTRG